MPFSKNQDILEVNGDEDSDDKFQIKIRLKEESNLKIGSIQLLSSEEVFELHCGNTNEYISTKYCDFIDKVDQQFVIYYGYHNFIKNRSASSSTSLRNESSFKNSINLIFPKFNSSLKDTIWIFTIKLNLIESRSICVNNNNLMGNVIPLMQMFKQIKKN